MSDDAGAALLPYVLDASVLTELARGDYDLMTFVQRLDALGRPMVVPALAVTAAALDTQSGDAEAILDGLERMSGTMTAAVADTEQAVRLAAVIAATDLDPWDAHVAAVADASVCPILTINGPKWRQHAHDLEEPLHFIEIAEPDDEDG